MPEFDPIRAMADFAFLRKGLSLLRVIILIDRKTLVDLVLDLALAFKHQFDFTGKAW